MRPRHSQYCPHQNCWGPYLEFIHDLTHAVDEVRVVVHETNRLANQHFQNSTGNWARSPTMAREWISWIKHWQHYGRASWKFSTCKAEPLSERANVTNEHPHCLSQAGALVTTTKGVADRAQQGVCSERRDTYPGACPADVERRRRVPDPRSASLPL